MRVIARPEGRFALQAVRYGQAVVIAERRVQVECPGAPARAVRG